MPGRKRKRATKVPPSLSKSPSTVTASPVVSRKKYRQWSEESMLGALKAVKDGAMGCNRAATEYGVPKTTLKDRISGRVTHGCKSGRSPYLTPAEEKELYDWLVLCASIGYPKSRDDVIGIVRKTLHDKEEHPVEDIKGRGWWLRFMQRWPQLSLRKGDALAQSRAAGVNAVSINNYFDLLKKTLTTHRLLDCPNRIYNMDESGLPLDHKPPKVIALKGAKKVHCRTSGNKMQITVLACANAGGTVIPSMVIFEGKRLNPEWTKGEVPCTLYGMSDKGWTDMELFSYWMKDLFLPSIPPARPVLLLVDGHSSHYEPETIRYAASQDVVVLCLPPHTTHVSQPLDVSFFKPLKSYWSEVCHRYTQDNPGRVVTKYQFSSLFSTAWYKAVKPETIVNGFRKVGVCPFDSTVPDVPMSENPDDTGADQGGHESDDSASSDPSAECDLTEETGSRVMDVDNDAAQATTLTPAQLELFETRYENGYVCVYLNCIAKCYS